MNYKELSNLFYSHWRRVNWVIDPNTFISHFKQTRINKPFFFVGNQGGGLTLISRMLRRNPSVISITGNNTYWTGADEMQRVMVARLPKTLRLSGQFLNSDPSHPVFSPPRSWSYGSDDLVDDYHMTEDDYDSAESKTLQKIIWEALYRFSDNPSEARFIDKSQLYTLKMRYIEALLEDSEPYFVLISRDPVAACYRAATGKAGDLERYKDKLSFEERLEVCIQHWYNCMSIALEDSKHVNHFRHFRFEDFLTKPEKSVKLLCKFLGLNYYENMIPQPHHSIPFGTRYSKRWYPLKENVNKKYFKEILPANKEKILIKCGNLANTLGYKY